MRWPFISRTTHDALMAAKDDDYLDRVKYWRESATQWRSWYDAVNEAHRDFVAKMVEVATPKPAPVITPPKPREPDAADHAIALASAFDPRRRRHLEQFVRARRSEGKDAQDIAQEVLHPKADGLGEWEMPE